MKKILFGIFGVLCSLPAIALTISGTVVDENNEPLIGAVVYSSATQQGLVVDENGSFNQNLDVDSSVELTVSLLGYKDKTVKASELNNKTIVLEEDSMHLEEAVVVACGNDSLEKANATSGTWSEEQKRCIPTKCKEPRYELEFAGTDMAKCVDQVGMPCFDCDVGADSCEYALDNGQFICKVMSCLMDDEKVENNECVSRLGDDCINELTDKNVAAAEFATNLFTGEVFCQVTKCKDGYKVNDDETGCIEMLQECTDNQKSQHPNASKTGIKKGTETCIALDCVCGYKLENEKCVEQTERACTKDTKPKLPKNAKSAKMVCENGVAVCKIEECDGVEFELRNNACVKITGDDCKSGDAKAIKTKLEKRNNTMVCVIKTCSKGYVPADDGLTCVQSEGDCTAEQLAALDKNATKGELKKQKCIITECKDGFEPDNNKCVTISGFCKPEDKNATSGKRKFDTDSQTEICVVTGCVGGYDPSEDGTKCVENADEKKKIDDAQAKYDAAKANEQSTANKLLGAASMGSMGVGGMMVASSLSEQKADEAAEMDMAAYLATFKCDYGAGMNIKGGETNIELPGASELIPLYSEYVALANDLKVRKSQLGLKAGIESEKILDSATTGLYDDVGVGITSGAYASLARALQNPDGEDAKMWAEQKEKTAQNLKTGAITAGVGAAVGVAGNIISDEMYENKKSDAVQKLEEDIAKIKNADITCPSGATGTYPNCICNSNKEYSRNANECHDCTGGRIAQIIGDEQRCVCKSQNQEFDEGRQRCVDKQSVPVCNGDIGEQLQNGICVIVRPDSEIEEDDDVELTEMLLEMNLPAAALFEVGKADLLDEAKKTLDSFAENLKSEGIRKCSDFSVAGYTDPTGNKDKNLGLSAERATAVHDYLMSKQDFKILLQGASMGTIGYGQANCTCGVLKDGVPSDKENDSDYKYCVGKPATAVVPDGTPFAPCRRVKISMKCENSVSE